MNKYILEIYEPGSDGAVLQEFESSEPFMNINKGETVNTVSFPQAEGLSETLEVVQVEHILWQRDGDEEPTQKVLIFTEEIGDE